VPEIVQPEAPRDAGQRLGQVEVAEDRRLGVGEPLERPVGALEDLVGHEDELRPDALLPGHLQRLTTRGRDRDGQGVLRLLHPEPQPDPSALEVDRLPFQPEEVALAEARLERHDEEDAGAEKARVEAAGSLGVATPATAEGPRAPAEAGGGGHLAPDLPGRHEAPEARLVVECCEERGPFLGIHLEGERRFLLFPDLAPDREDVDRATVLGVAEDPQEDAPHHVQRRRGVVVPDVVSILPAVPLLRRDEVPQERRVDLLEAVVAEEGEEVKPDDGRLHLGRRRSCPRRDQGPPSLDVLAERVGLGRRRPLGRFLLEPREAGAGVGQVGHALDRQTAPDLATRAGLNVFEASHPRPGIPPEAGDGPPGPLHPFPLLTNSRGHGSTRFLGLSVYATIARQRTSIIVTP